LASEDDALDFQLTDEQSQLQHLIGRFLSGSYGEGMRARYRAADIGYSRENWQTLADLGLLSLPFRAEDGGLGGELEDLAVLMESLGRGLVAEPVLEEVIIAAGVLASAASPALKAEWLPAVMSGQ
jgi:alkylation response protein AidB-like acyl-CoA dehydrogenase